MGLVSVGDWGMMRGAPSKINVAISIAVIFLLLMFCVDSGSAWFRGEQKVLLKNLHKITLKKGYMSSGEKSVPQLRCVGGTARCKYKPDVVECYHINNRGNIQWECKPQKIRKDFKFGSVNVSCEAFEEPDGIYIAPGTCYMEYTLHLTLRGISRLASREYYEGSWTVEDIKMAIIHLAPFVAAIILYFKLFHASSSGGSAAKTRSLDGVNPSTITTGEEDLLRYCYYESSMEPSASETDKEDSSHVAKEAEGDGDDKKETSDKKEDDQVRESASGKTPSQSAFNMFIH